MKPDNLILYNSAHLATLIHMHTYGSFLNTYCTAFSIWVEIFGKFDENFLQILCIFDDLLEHLKSILFSFFVPFNGFKYVEFLIFSILHGTFVHFSV